MAVTIEVSKGRYLRHLRERAGYNQRQLMAAVNELLPPSEQKTHQWYAALEVDTVSKLSVPMAIALHRLIGAELGDLGIEDDEVAQFRQLVKMLDEPPVPGLKRGRDQPKRSNTCISDRVIARPNAPLKCPNSGGILLWGRDNAHSS